MSHIMATKGCSHCDSRGYCPRELKYSQENVSDHVRIAVTETGEWASICPDFFRDDAKEWRRRVRVRRG